jgi:RES domain-containing protein
MTSYMVNIGKYRGKFFRYYDSTSTILVPSRSLPDGTTVTILFEHPDLPLVTLNEDKGFYWYPLDLLTPIRKSDYILRRLKCS